MRYTINNKVCELLIDSGCIKNVISSVVVKELQLQTAKHRTLTCITLAGFEKAEITRQEARLKMERENLEKEKSVLMGTASSQDNQDGALEITVSGEKYRCLRFSKAKK